MYHLLAGIHPLYALLIDAASQTTQTAAVAAQAASQAATQAVGEAIPHGATQLQTQFGAAAVCAYLIRLLQKAKSLPQITNHSDGINRTLRIVTSFIAAVGVGWKWNGVDHTLLITGLSLATVLTAGWHWFQQYAMTHVIGGALNAAGGSNDKSVQH